MDGVHKGGHTCGVVFQGVADDHGVRACLEGGLHGNGVTKSTAHDEWQVGGLLDRGDDGGWHGMGGTASRLEVECLETKQFARKRGGGDERQVVGRERLCLAHSLHGGGDTAVDEHIARGDDADGRTRDGGRSLDVFVDEKAWVSAGDERQEQQGIRLGRELGRGAREEDELG